MILSNIWYNQIAEPWKHSDTPPYFLKLIVMGLDLKTLFIQPDFSHLWDYRTKLIYFFSWPFGTLPGGIKELEAWQQ